MTNQITPESISLIVHQNIPVITTELLAQLYGTESVRIRQGYTRNKERFIEGKHYFVAKGQILENLKVSLRYFQQIAPNVRKLILWTERGAARHAKMLETDQAWEVFEKLEDSYFNQKGEHPVCSDSIHHGDPRTVLVRFDENGNIRCTESVSPDAVVATLDRVKFWLEREGWLVIRKEDLLEKLTRL